MRTASSICNVPMAAKTVAPWPELTAGLAVCATAQIAQQAASVWLGWWWVDSADTARNKTDNASHADQRLHNRMNYPSLQIRLSKAYNGYPAKRNAGQVTIERPLFLWQVMWSLPEGAKRRPRAGLDLPVARVTSVR